MTVLRPLAWETRDQGSLLGPRPSRSDARARWLTRWLRVASLLLPLAGCGDSTEKAESGAAPAPDSQAAAPASRPAAAAEREELRQFRAEASALAKTFGERLRGELADAMAANGPVAAIEVCSRRAPEIAAEISTDTLTIRRIGTRVRNKATNTPTPAQRDLLERLSATTPEYVGSVDGHPTYLKAIILQDAVCLNCHGPRESIAPEVLAKLAELYPDDEATGYAAGDLRGAFVVERRDNPAPPDSALHSPAPSASAVPPAT